MNPYSIKPTFSTLKRLDTDLVFTVSSYGHESKIINKNDKTDTDLVRWYGQRDSRQLYISCIHGHTYEVLD